MHVEFTNYYDLYDANNIIQDTVPITIAYDVSNDSILFNAAVTPVSVAAAENPPQMTGTASGSPDAYVDYHVDLGAIALDLPFAETAVIVERSLSPIQVTTPYGSSAIQFNVAPQDVYASGLQHNTYAGVFYTDKYGSQQFAEYKFYDDVNLSEFGDNTFPDITCHFMPQGYYVEYPDGVDATPVTYPIDYTNFDVGEPLYVSVGAMATMSNLTAANIVLPENIARIGLSPAHDHYSTYLHFRVFVSYSRVNDKVTAISSAYTAQVFRPLTVRLKGTDLWGYPVAFQVTSDPALGELSGYDDALNRRTASGTLTYIPTAEGTDSFSFVAYSTNPNLYVQDTGTVSITITPYLITIDGGDIGGSGSGAARKAKSRSLTKQGAIKDVVYIPNF